MAKFKCWDPEMVEEDEAKDVEADTAARAAEKFADAALLTIADYRTGRG